MSTEKRYLFQGHAVAAESHIRKPREICWIQGAMALPVTGGCGNVRLADTRCEVPDRGRISFASASAFVSGDYTGSANAAGERPIRTEAAAYVNNLNVLDRLKVDSLAAHLVLDDSRQGEPRISFGTTSPFSDQAEPRYPIMGLSIDNCPVNVEFDPIIREGCFTLGELQEEFQQRCEVEWYGGMMAVSIVSSLSWPGDRQPQGAEIQSNNTIVLAGFGTIHLGELIVQKRSRQLTLLRLQLEGQDNDAFCDAYTNGQGWPPVGG